MAKRGRPKKDPWADLPEGFAEATYSATDEEVRAQINKSAMINAATTIAKKDDMDLAQKKGIAKIAGEGYRLSKKENDLIISFCRQLLKDRGRDVPGASRGRRGVDVDEDGDE